MSLRDNQDLDDVFLEGKDKVKEPARGQKRRRAKGLDRDGCRRHGFRVLALLAELPAGDRERVLRWALKVHRT